MKVAIVGTTGQLGFELQKTAPKGIELLLISRSDLDMAEVTQPALASVLKDADAVINASAYTAVDKAESESDLAYKVNAEAVKQLAEYTHKQGIQFIHVSTDFVFKGDSITPYIPEDTKEPQSVYGASKAKGESYLQQYNPKATCIRTSWVYSTYGNNFVKTMLRLMNERDNLGVVADQIGSPTYAEDLAHFIWQLVEHPCEGMLHYSNEGLCSWYDFAMAIYIQGQKKGLISSPCAIAPITTADYPTPAKRPAFSLLDKQQTKQKTQAVIPHWLTSLNNMMDQLVKNNENI